MAVRARECLAQRMCRTEMDVAGLSLLLLLLEESSAEVSLGLDLAAALPLGCMAVVVVGGGGVWLERWWRTAAQCCPAHPLT